MSRRCLVTCKQFNISWGGIVSLIILTTNHMTHSYRGSSKNHTVHSGENKSGLRSLVFFSRLRRWNNYRVQRYRNKPYGTTIVPSVALIKTFVGGVKCLKRRFEEPMGWGVGEGSGVGWAGWEVPVTLERVHVLWWPLIMSRRAAKSWPSRWTVTSQKVVY